MYDWQGGANYATTDNTGAPDHIGIVTKVGGGTFVVTEGNMNGGKVGKRTMKAVSYTHLAPRNRRRRKCRRRRRC